MSMKKGDKLLFYHSVTEKAVVGTANVSKGAVSPTQQMRNGSRSRSNR